MFDTTTKLESFHVHRDPVTITAQSIRNIIHDNTTNKITAIKDIRNLWGIGLKDAKEIYEAVYEEMGKEIAY